MTEAEWAIRTLRDCVRTYVPGGLDAVLTHSEQERIRVALLPEHAFVPWIGGVNEVCSRCGLAATDAEGEPCVSVEDRVAKIDRWWGDYMVRLVAERASLVPFPPGALKPEWEGDPAHAQTVAATDKQIDGFNQPDGEQEWVIYFTNPHTGARAQMFARLRPYPEMRAPGSACCHREGHIGGVLHVCNRAAGHEPPCIMELFTSSEPRDPPGLRIGATQTVGRTTDGRVSVDVLTISVAPNGGGPTNG